MDTGEVGGEVRVQSILRGYGCGGDFGEEGGGAEEAGGDSGEVGEEKKVCEGG